MQNDRRSFHPQILPRLMTISSVWILRSCFLSVNGAAQPTKKETTDFCRPIINRKAKQEILCMTSIFLCDLDEPGTNATARITSS
jgi:hypothetical protein